MSAASEIQMRVAEYNERVLKPFDASLKEFMNRHFTVILVEVVRDEIARRVTVDLCGPWGRA